MQVEILSCGHCIQAEAFSKGNGKHHKVEFPSSVVLIDHPKHGVILFDSGYSNAFIEETKKYPERLYAIATPVTISSATSAKSQLLERGIQPDDVKHIIISHFHADHVAGLRDFPSAKFHFAAEAFQPFLKWSRLRQVSQGYLRGLLPEDFNRRGVPYNLQSMTQPTGLNFFERAHFLFGDEGLGLVPLNGHATGHIGLLLRGGRNAAFFVGDACWHRDNFLKNSPPMRLAVSWLGDYQQYRTTLNALENFSQVHREIQIIPCHCGDSHQSFYWHDQSPLNKPPSHRLPSERNAENSQVSL